MAKRTWNESNQDSSPNGSSAHENNDAVEPRQRPRNGSTSVVSPGTAVARSNDMSALQNIPTISRKVKACAACRKQKVRCLMDDGPPCRRCNEKDLSCVLNKSLQTLIDERLPSSDALIQDLEMVYSSVQTVLRTLNLPSQAPLQSSKYNTAHTPVSVEHIEPSFVEDAGPSCDNSPKLSPEDDRDLPRVPIQSVYHLTKLRSLRSPEASNDAPPLGISGARKAGDDLIARGLLQLHDAERLFRLYTDHLDHYIYNVGARYNSLDTLRHKSPILTAAILTVGAQHDPQSNGIFLVCNREFRRLMTASLFDRRIDKDHLRALCVASYWLNDSSWMLSGIASRRAASFNISSQFNKLVTESNEDAADFVRIWYLIYICDQHLSTLYGRECQTREDAAVQKWELMVKATPSAGDLRLASQVALLTIIHNIRELFGSDADKPIPVVFLTQIKGFDRQLDQWLGHWSTTLPEYQDGIGTFPRKGALFHFQFAKLYLYSHVFRGLHSSPPPPSFLEAARGAVSAAASILNMILTDHDVKESLVGLPAYIQSMIAFACMFLARLSTLYGDEMIETKVVIDLISRLVVVYRATPVGKWHLIPLMADGLEKIVNILREPPATEPVDGLVPIEAPYNIGQMDMGMMNLDPSFLMDPSMGMGMGMGAPEQPFFGDEFGFGTGMI